MSGVQAGAIDVLTRPEARHRRERIARMRERIRQRRRERARRAHELRTSGPRAPFVSGSEHTHMLLGPKGF
jgi:PleD family two-component response regulator